MMEQLDRKLLQISNVQGVTHAKVLTLPQPLRRIIHRLMKKGRQGQMSLTELAQGLQTNEDKGQQIADLLIEKGYLYGVEHPETGELVYGVRFGQKRGRDLPLDLRNALQSLKPIQLIEVKSDLGAGTRGSDLGSDALKMASWQLNRQLFANYPSREISSQQYLPSLAKETPFAKGITAIYEVYQQISEAVKNALQQNALPVVISGDHSTAGGTIAGIKIAYPESRLGVIWIDAHADIHTPFTTPSGNMLGMPVATALAEDNLASGINKLDEKTVTYWNKIKQLGKIVPKLNYQDLVYIAVRDTEPQEDYLIAQHNIRNFTTTEVRDKGINQVVQEILERLQDCDRLYISFDVDSMDPNIVSDGTGTPVAGGLTDTEASQLISRLIGQGKVCCFEICEINPVLDGRGNRMAQSAFGILENATSRMSSVSN